MEAKKLHLHRETLRELTAGDASRVMGGTGGTNSNRSPTICCTLATGSLCNTDDPAGCTQTSGRCPQEADL